MIFILANHKWKIEMMFDYLDSILLCCEVFLTHHLSNEHLRITEQPKEEALAPSHIKESFFWK